MDEKSEEKRKQLIRERMAPKSRKRRTWVLVATVLVSAVLFGGVAGLMFSVSRDIFSNSPSTEVESIFISRDDPLASTEEVTAKASKSSQEDQGETGTGSQEQKTSEAGPEEAETEAETIPSMKDVYTEISRSTVTVTVSSLSGSDLSGQPLYTKSRSFGLIIAESEDAFFALTDLLTLSEGDSLTVQYKTDEGAAEILGQDGRMQLTVLKIPKTNLILTPKAASLGNSFILGVTDPVYSFGDLHGNMGEMEEGRISYMETYVSVLDGYAQMICTDLDSDRSGTGVLLNQKGEVVGWENQVLTAGTKPAAIGISSIKYLLEDLCSGQKAAYLGLFCKEVKKSDGLTPGLYISSVEADSPAYSAGLQTGDRISEFNGHLIYDNYGLANALDNMAPGEKAEIVVIRQTAEQEETLTVTVTVGQRS